MSASSHGASDHHRAPEGAMKEEYAIARRDSGPLVFRYRTRARAATQAFHEYYPGRTPERALELGSADGRTLLEIRRLFGSGGQHDGVEISKELLAHAPQGIPGVRWVQGDVTDLPGEILACKYSLITALALLEHLDDPLACLEQSVAVLDDGGVFVATCPNPVWDAPAGRLGLVRDEHHVQAMNADRMVGLFRNVGLRDVRFVPFMWLPVALLPYVRVNVGSDRALAIDRRIRRLGTWTRTMFINQLVAGIK